MIKFKKFRAKVLSEAKRFKAGGFPYFIDSKGVVNVCLFVSNDPMYGGPDPQIPKGTPDPGETPKTVAAREASEETGIPVRDLMKRATEVSVKDFRGEVSNYEFHCYAFKLDRKVPALTTEEGKGIWMTLDTAMSSMRRDQRVFLKDFADKVS